MVMYCGADVTNESSASQSLIMIAQEMLKQYVDTVYGAETFDSSWHGLPLQRAAWVPAFDKFDGSSSSSLSSSDNLSFIGFSFRRQLSDLPERLYIARQGEL